MAGDIPSYRKLTQVTAYPTTADEEYIIETEQGLQEEQWSKEEGSLFCHKKIILRRKSHPQIILSCQTTSAYQDRKQLSKDTQLKEKKQPFIVLTGYILLYNQPMTYIYTDKQWYPFLELVRTHLDRY